MNYRQLKAVRFEQLLWVTNKTDRAGISSLSNKYVSTIGRDFVHVLALELPRLSM